MEKRVEEKKAKLLKALESGITQIHLDARRPGVLVPQSLKNDHHLILNVSFRFDPPDLTVNDWGVRETLSFQGSRFTVGLPWSAIYAVASLVTREFFMYPDDMPEELMQGATEKVPLPTPTEEAVPSPRTVLREVVSSPMPLEASAEAASEPAEPTEPSPPKRGHLRLVK
jgi:stringent starvation protein B